MARPHYAALLEDAVFGHVARFLRARGWRERVIGYTGYGTPTRARVLARVLIGRPDVEEGDATRGWSAADALATLPDLLRLELNLRGWRHFVTAPAATVPVRAQLGDADVELVTDRSGYIDVTLTDHGLAPGRHEVTLTAANGSSASAGVHIIAADQRVGIVSDIDDTVMVTHLPRALLAAWNTFVASEQAREQVPGMAAMYRSLMAEDPGAPIFYLSTGAWNIAPSLVRFLKRHDFPHGPLLLTDWGPTNTGWFRSGQQHKRAELDRLMREFPQCQWLLVGDDGQHDPGIYGDFAREHPDHVEAVAIRQLTPAQQVLSHGLPIATDELLGKRHGVPMLRAGNGFLLHTLIRRARSRRLEARSA